MATDPSNLEFENPLDVLAAVASETLKYEIRQPEASEVNVPSTVRKQNKKSSVSFLTFETVRCMSGKALIDKFSEMKSEEYTKKYYYKCLLLPKSCSKTFRSFGNEKKAYQEMKSHLLEHLDTLAEEYELNGSALDAIFVPKSPTSKSKHVDKIAKRSHKKQHASHNGVQYQTNSSKKSKKSTLKTGKRKFQATKTLDFEVKNTYDRVKFKKRKVVNNIKENSSVKLSNDGHFIETEFTQKYRDRVSDNENYSNYNQCLDFAIYNDAEVSEPSSGSEQEINDSNDFDVKMTELSNSAAQSFESFPHLLHHDYTSLEGPKLSKQSTSEYEPMPRRYQNPFLYKKYKKYAIRTPGYPYLYSPWCPDIAAVVEIMGFYNHNTHKWENSPIRFSDDPFTSHHVVVPPDESLSDSEDKYSELFAKGSGVSNSVLECVENIENKKHSSSSVPKGGISARENDENLEHRQKTERELALNYISKMHLKGKKKLTDSLHCKICPDKSFTAQATLLHHYRSHAGIKPYSCKLCPQRFTRQHSLNYHMLIHQNLSRFTCKVCGRTFRHPSHFKEHSRRHTGETPYHCTDCNLHFKTRNTFKRHLKTRHGKLLTAGGIEDLNSE